MRYKWLNKNVNSKLIVFFNGWGMDENIVSHLACDGYDIIMLYDYNTLEMNIDKKEFEKYNTRHLVAWSMGVMVATLFDDIYDTKTAINGTLKPIDNKYGIPEKIYNLTLKAFSPKGAEKFIRNMFSDACEFPNVSRNFENQRQELFALTQYSSNMEFEYTRVIISDDDKIIPTKNQIAYWNTNSNIHGGHAIFHHFNHWSELL